MTPDCEPIAHVSEGQPSHALKDHLLKTAHLAESFAQTLYADMAYMAGLWHDLGKYNPDFQAYIRSVSPKDRFDAHLEDEEQRQTQSSSPATKKIDHSTAGAWWALQQMPAPFGTALSYMIAGHHAGLADWNGGLHDRFQRKGLACLQQIQDHVPKNILAPERLNHLNLQHPVDPALWIRMIFSCLVDADFLDTERYMKGDGYTDTRGQYPSLDMLFQRYQAYMEGKKTLSSPLGKIRHDILTQCLQKACDPRSFFSLTVPTGGGKTLASLGFSLKHALTNNKKRIIYVIPYTSILEQTADVFRSVFGQNVVIEHHSQFDSDKKGEQCTKQKFATENWDAPIIVTTTVQFFESLYAVRTSRVRKLHNIMDSIVIFDEAQLLPPEMLDPVRHVMKELMTDYGVTMVLSTATQPALHNPPMRDGQTKRKIDFKDFLPVELMDDPASLYQSLERVQVKYDPATKPLTWEEVADQVGRHDQALAIVNTRESCKRLFQLLEGEAYHLSALMCGEHRSHVIAEIKGKLQSGSAVKVISTQLIEAGVDIDFPVVYRAMAGLDSIAQAAGRCNREGNLSGKGQVIVFNAKEEFLLGLLRQAQQSGKELLRKAVRRGENPLSPSYFTDFFQHFYGSVVHSEGYDSKKVLEYVEPNPLWHFDFLEASKRFQIIEDNQKPVLVAYGEGKDLIARLLQGDISKDILRKAQRYTVNVLIKQHEALLNNGSIQEIKGLEGVFVQTQDSLYHSQFGIMLEGV